MESGDRTRADARDSGRTWQSPRLGRGREAWTGVDQHKFAGSRQVELKFSKSVFLTVGVGYSF